MEIDFLRHFGFTPAQIKLLQTAYGSQLLPLQERVIRDGHLMEGANLLISAPTSSGKTFLAEILFLHQARQGRNAVLLVPTKALANQRYEQLSKRYQSLGYDILLSTRDHPYDDRRILDGRFHLAILIYEKMRALSAMNDSFLAALGACIVDENHYLYQPERGPDLELLLTRLRREKQLQLLGLSAVLTGETLGKWLGGAVITETQRPVELRQGVLCGHRFVYQEFNHRREGVETFDLPDTGDEGELMLHAARFFAATGETTLLFWPRRDLCYTAARKLAQTYEAAACRAIKSLESLEPTSIRDFLAFLLPRRVAVHTGDLTPAERAIVEQAVQNGEVVLICATSTLAEGINFPVTNVITTRRMYAQRMEELQNRKPPASLPLSRERFLNMIGRAGRLGLSEFGRGIMVTVSPGDCDGLMNVYGKSTPGDFHPLLHNTPLSQLVLKTLGLAGARTPQNCRDFLRQTLTGQLQLWQKDLEASILKAGEQLQQDGLILEEHGYWQPTPLGNLVLKSGLSVESVTRLHKFVENRLLARISLLEILIQICRLNEIESLYFHLTRGEIQNHTWSRELLRIMETENPGSDSPLHAWLATPNRILPTHHSAFKKALLLREWAAGEPWTPLEKRYGVYAGTISRLVEETAWIFGCLIEIAAARAMDSTALQRFNSLLERIIFGLPETALDWTPLIRIRELNRTEALRLIQAGYNSPSRIREEDRDLLRQMVSEAAVTAIFRTFKPPIPESPTSVFYEIKMDAARPDILMINGHPVELTSLQTGLVQSLIRHHGVCVDYEVIMQEMWNQPGYGDKKQLSRQKNQLLAKVRKILGKKPTPLIEMVRGRGLVLNAKILRD